VSAVWAWSASAPGAAASGVSDDIGRAQRAASGWMREHGADAGLLEEVRLAIGAGSLAPRHERTGAVLRGRRYRNGRVRWSSPARAA
jgi:hypothetical protein